ncbi:fructosamine kinase family protein [Algicola sagamiensis]|uniref:fructosamine kinase family protein n=1 Tax=Algicola sagamiensis TaxID=163869 RepID=UPI0003740D22|nr:fructosamine kinase family protein [Algicola sagamiensis]
MWHAVAEQISDALGTTFTIEDKQAIGGGDINLSYVISSRHETLFIKINQKSFFEAFETEMFSLHELELSDTIRVPEVLCTGTTLDKSFLVMEYIPLEPHSDIGWGEAGEMLAELHAIHEQECFGLDEENYIGTNLQPNGWHKKWCIFFAEQRIGWMLQILEEKGHSFGDIEEIIGVIKHYLGHHKPKPSLLHGDLWRGNIGFHENEPVFYDPSSYYGDAEADIAMTELFGPFPPQFYQGYYATFPKSSGYELRRNIYNLYHLLNHAILFRGQYVHEAGNIIKQLMS